MSECELECLLLHVKSVLEHVSSCDCCSDEASVLRDEAVLWSPSGSEHWLKRAESSSDITKESRH